MEFTKYLEMASGGDTSATTFYHEILCGIFIIDPNAIIKNGDDVKKWFDNKKIIAIGGANAKPVDYLQLPQSRYFDKKQIVNQAYIKDALNLAIKFRTKANITSVKKVLWTGPTNDSSQYGAADIVVFTNKDVFPISLKYGKGQLKNLSMNSIGDILEITKPNNNEDAVVGEIIENYRNEWDKLTRAWIKWIGDQIAVNHTKALEIFMNNAKNFKTWDDFNNRPIKINNIEKLYNLCKIHYKDKTSYKHFRKFCAKYYETYFPVNQSNEWTEKIRKKAFENTIGAYFKSQESKFKKNVKKLFAVQLSIQENDYWYAANGGKDIKLIPGKVRFENGIKNLKVTYSFENSGTGYIIPLVVENKKNEKLLEIKIIFRWVQGQMFGNISTASVKKEYIDDWTKYFV